MCRSHNTHVVTKCITYKIFCSPSLNCDALTRSSLVAIFITFKSTVIFSSPSTNANRDVNEIAFDTVAISSDIVTELAGKDKMKSNKY